MGRDDLLRRGTTAKDGREYLDFLRSQLKDDGPEGRRRRYASPDFPETLASIAKASSQLGIPHDIVRTLVKFGGEMRAESLNMSDQTWAAIRVWPPELGDRGDSFFTYFEGVMSGVVRKESTKLVEQILRQIDSNFAEPIEGLLRSVPGELAQSQGFLTKAVDSFTHDRKEESTLFTRKAWEACVNFGLSKLPKADGLNSLTKKTKYVLENLGMKDESRSITQIKELFERRFLHVIDSEEKLPEPEVPFFIALTTGFVHLVASHLTP